MSVYMLDPWAYHRRNIPRDQKWIPQLNTLQYSFISTEVIREITEFLLILFILRFSLFQASYQTQPGSSARSGYAGHTQQRYFWLVGRPTALLLIGRWRKGRQGNSATEDVQMEVVMVLVVFGLLSCHCCHMFCLWSSFHIQLVCLPTGIGFYDADKFEIQDCTQIPPTHNFTLQWIDSVIYFFMFFLLQE